MDAAAEAAAPAIPSHPLIPSSAPELLGDADMLAAFLDHIREAGSYAFDTEFIGEETYHTRICLIQLATTERVALFDPLAGIDVDPVWSLIADPAVQTIVHAGQQDLEPVVRHLDKAPANIFDTQIACAFVNRPYPMSMRQMVEDVVDVRLGKAYTFTRWDRRPLSKAQRRYAADDVRFLPAIADILTADLTRRGHLDWALEECATLAEADRYRFDLDRWLARAVGARNRKRRTLGIVRELLILRDTIAREEDVPPRSLFKDDVLIRLADDPTRPIDGLAGVKGFPRPMASSHGHAIKEAIERGRALPTAELPRGTSNDESLDDRVAIDALFAIAVAHCHGRGVAPSLALNRRTISDVYAAFRAGGDPASALSGQWRRDLLNPVLAMLTDPTARLSIAWGEGGLRSGDDNS